MCHTQCTQHAPHSHAARAHTPTFGTGSLPHPLLHGPSLSLFVHFMTSPSLSATSTDPNTFGRKFYSKDQCFQISCSQSLCTCPTFHTATSLSFFGSISTSMDSSFLDPVASPVFSRRDIVQLNPRNPAPPPPHPPPTRPPREAFLTGLLTRRPP